MHDSLQRVCFVKPARVGCIRELCRVCGRCVIHEFWVKQRGCLSERCQRVRRRLGCGVRVEACILRTLNCAAVHGQGITAAAVHYLASGNSAQQHKHGKE